MCELPMFISYFRSSDPTEQTLKPHHPRGGARDEVRLSFESEHSRDDFSVWYNSKKSAWNLCILSLSSLLHEGIRHS